MYLTGFVETDHVSDRALSLESQEITTLHEVAKEKDIAIAIGLIESKGNTFYNSTILITPEERVALCYRKTHLWPDERNLVQPGDRLSTCLWRGTRIGLLICYDIEFPEPARALASMGADLLLITNGNMDPYGKVHNTAALSRAMENQIFIAMANRAGQGTGLTFAGESTIVDPLGNIVAKCDRSEQTCHASIDLSLIHESRQEYCYKEDRKLSLTGHQVEHGNAIKEWVINN